MGKTKIKKRNARKGPKESKKPKKQLAGSGTKTKVIKKLGKLAKRGKLKAKEKAKLFRIRNRRQMDSTKRKQAMASDWEDTRLARDEHDADIDSIATTITIEQLEERRRQRIMNESGKQVKHLLPIKSDTGKVLAQSVELDNDDTQSDVDWNEEMDTGVAEGLLDHDLEQEKHEVGLELKSLDDCKVHLAKISHQIIQDPESQIIKLKQLLLLTNELNCGVVVDTELQPVVARFAIASLLEIFVDVIPGYRIRETDANDTKLDADTGKQLKKETRKLLEFEQGLLRYYKQYLQRLEALVQPALTSKESNKACILAATSLCTLMVRVTHFNYINNIINVVVQLATARNPQIRQLSCNGLRDLFAADETSGEATLHAVRSINKLTSTKLQQVHPELLGTLVHLKVKEVERSSDIELRRTERLKRKEELRKMSKKARKYEKQLDELRSELKETEVRQDRNARLIINTETMKSVFHIYFIVLRRAPRTKLLRPTLEGLSKFAHLINIDFYDDLVGSLYELIEHQDLHALDCLQAIHTVFQLLCGEGHAVNIDPSRFYHSMYRLLPVIVLETDAEFQLKQFDVCLRALDIMLVQRRKLLNIERVAAFIKRLSLLCLITVRTPPLLAMLGAVRSFLLTNSKLLNLVNFDDDEVVGTFGRAYLPAINDPEHCNANTSTLAELRVLQAHPDATVRQFVANILGGVPLYGVHKLRPELAYKKPWEYLTMHNNRDCDNAKISEYRKMVIKQAKVNKTATTAEDATQNTNCSQICAVIHSTHGKLL